MKSSPIPIPFDVEAFLETSGILQAHGVEEPLDDVTREELLRIELQKVSRRLLYQEDEFYAILDRLSQKEWLDFLKKNPDLSPIAKWINLILWRKKNLKEKKQWRLAQGLFLRKIIQIWRDEGKCDYDYISKEFSEGPKRLPRGWSPPGSIRYRTGSEKNFSDFLDSAYKVWHKKPWHHIDLNRESDARKIEFNGEPIYLSQFRWNRYARYTNLNRQLKVNGSQRIFASKIFQSISLSQSIQFQDQVMEWILSVMIGYGMELDKILDLSLSPSKSGPGHIDGQGIHLNLGNVQYEKSSEVYEKSIVFLCWNPISKLYFDLIDYQKKECRRVVDLIPEFSLDLFNRFFESRWKTGFSVKKFDRIIHALHQGYWAIGTLDQKISKGELSILKGIPINPHRGLCSYIGITQARINEIHAAIESTIFKDADIDHQNHFSFSECPKLHGSLYKPWEENIERLDYWIENAGTINQLTFLWICLLRILGLRNTNTHPHPRAVIIDYPFPSFAFQDKQVAYRWPLRVIPFISLAQIFKGNEGYDPSLEVAYEENGDLVSWEELNSKEKKKLESMFYISKKLRNQLRSSLINYFLEEAFGEVPLCSNSGHSSAELQVGGINSLVSPLDHLSEINRHWEKIAPELGLERIAQKLMDRARELGGFKSIVVPAKEKRQIRRFSGEKPSVRQDIGMMLPRENQNRIFELLKTNFSEVEKMDPAIKLILLISLHHHLPLKYWIDYKPYLTLNSFFKTQDNLYLRLVIAQDDAGGIGSVPLSLGNIHSPKNQFILDLVRKLQNRALSISKGSDVSKWSLFFESNLNRHTIGQYLLQAIHLTKPRFLSEKNSLFRDINHVLCFRLFIHYPGVFGAALTHRNVFQLNEASLQDVVGLIENKKAYLFNLTGETYQEDLKLSLHGKTLRSRFSQSLRKLSKDLPRNDIYKFIKNHGRGISHSWLSKLLPHFTICRKRRKARLLARDFIKNLRKEGKCVRTKSFPLLSRLDLDILIEGVLQKIMAQDLGQGAKIGLSAYLLAGICSGARIGEISRLDWTDFEVFGNQIHLNIMEGKSRNAKRVVNLKMFEWTLPYLAQLQLLFPNSGKFKGYVWDSRELSRKSQSRLFMKRSGRINDTNEEAVAKKLSNYIKEVAKEKLDHSCEHFSFHTLRHVHAFYSVQEILNKHYWHGNYYSAMATFAAQMGHASFVFTQSSYIGTGCLGLKLPNFTHPHLSKPHSIDFSQTLNDIAA